MPDKFEYLRLIDELATMLDEALQRCFSLKNEALKQAREYFLFYNFTHTFTSKSQEIQNLKELTQRHIASLLQDKSQEVQNLQFLLQNAFSLSIKERENAYTRILEQLSARNPAILCARGYAQISQDERVRALRDIDIGEEFCLSDIQTSIYAKRVR